MAVVEVGKEALDSARNFVEETQSFGGTASKLITALVKQDFSANRAAVPPISSAHLH